MGLSLNTPIIAPHPPTPTRVSGSKRCTRSPPPFRGQKKGRLPLHPPPSVPDKMAGHRFACTPTTLQGNTVTVYAEKVPPFSSKGVIVISSLGSLPLLSPNLRAPPPPSTVAVVANGHARNNPKAKSPPRYVLLLSRFSTAILL